MNTLSQSMTPARPDERPIRCRTGVAPEAGMSWRRKVPHDRRRLGPAILFRSAAKPTHEGIAPTTSGVVPGHQHPVIWYHPGVLNSAKVQQATFAVRLASPPGAGVRDPVRRAPDPFRTAFDTHLPRTEEGRLQG
jgi:hypothetical protein